jgi:hypothetical protein
MVASVSSASVNPCDFVMCALTLSGRTTRRKFVFDVLTHATRVPSRRETNPSANNGAMRFPPESIQRTLNYWFRSGSTPVLALLASITWRKAKQTKSERENTAAARHSSTLASRAEPLVRTRRARRRAVQRTAGSAHQMATARNRGLATGPPKMSTRSLTPMNLILKPFLKAWKTDRSR